MKLEAARIVVPWFLLLGFWTKTHRAFLCFPGFLFQAMGSRLAYFHRVKFQVLLFPRLLCCLPPARSVCAPSSHDIDHTCHQPVSTCPDSYPEGQPFSQRTSMCHSSPETVSGAAVSIYVHQLSSCAQSPLRLAPPTLQMGK